jgi:hypothetical protein
MYALSCSGFDSVGIVVGLQITVLPEYATSVSNGSLAGSG